MQIPAHLSLERLCFSETAVRKGIDNGPDTIALYNLQYLQGRLTQVERILGRQIIISSGYRGPKLNAAIGGSKTSDHCNGLAADWVSPEFGTPFEVCAFLEGRLADFDQLIYEGTWVHLGFGPRKRAQLLTARFSKNALGMRVTKYEAGINL